MGSAEGGLERRPMGCQMPKWADLDEKFRQPVKEEADQYLLWLEGEGETHTKREAPGEVVDQFNHVARDKFAALSRWNLALNFPCGR